MKVNFFATLRQIVGGKTIEVGLPPGASVQAVLDELLARFPALREQLYDDQGVLYPHVHVFVNGRDARWLETGLGTPVGAADVLNIFPPVGGG